MKANRIAVLVAGAMTALAVSLSAQNGVTVPFSDPSRPGSLNVQILDGNLTIQGYDGAEVFIEIMGEDIAPQDVPERAQGLRRILSGGGFNVSESNNVVSVNTGFDDESDLAIRVPYTTSLMLNVVDGDVGITDVRGEIELHAIDGDVTLQNVSGPVVANAVDGDIVATLAGLPADAPTSISNVDGDIDLTLPADSRVTMTMRSIMGEVYTDFDIDILTEEVRGPDGLGRGGGFGQGDGSPMGRTMTGTINGGGVEVGLQTVEGAIYLRRGN